MATRKFTIGKKVRILLAGGLKNQIGTILLYNPHENPLCPYKINFDNPNLDCAWFASKEMEIYKLKNFNDLVTK